MLDFCQEEDGALQIVAVDINCYEDRLTGEPTWISATVMRSLTSTTRIFATMSLQSGLTFLEDGHW